VVLGQVRGAKLYNLKVQTQMEDKYGVLVTMLRPWQAPTVPGVETFDVMVAMGLITAPADGPKWSEGDKEVLVGNAKCLDASQTTIQLAWNAAGYLAQLPRKTAEVLNFLVPCPLEVERRTGIRTMNNGYNPTGLLMSIMKTTYFEPYTYPEELKHVEKRLAEVAATDDERVAAGLCERFSNMVCFMNVYESPILSPLEVLSVIHLCFGPHAGKLFKNGALLLPRTEVQMLKEELASALRDTVDKRTATRRFLIWAFKSEWNDEAKAYLEGVIEECNRM